MIYFCPLKNSGEERGGVAQTLSKI